MGKTVLITGTGRGIGFALAKQFLNNGYTVIGTSRTGEIANLLHTNFEVLLLDLSNQETINNFDKLLEDRNIKIDILINNAAIGPDLDTLKPDIKSFKQTFDVNVTGTVFFTELICRHIKAGGKIINISSKMGSIEFCNLVDSVAYRMSKTALNMYTKILTNRFLGTQTVASVHPGWVRTTIAKNNIVNGRLSTDESAIKIFNFVTSGFESGIFWDIETETKIEW
jgi:NAD(P)-dependent dehydrogenase (short-subunit alcohol dehydrogenase family)